MVLYKVIKIKPTSDFFKFKAKLREIGQIMGVSVERAKTSLTCQELCLTLLR